MIELPQSVTLSKRVTDQFRTIKTKTQVTNNVLARIALSLAIESDEDVMKAHKEDSLGQTLDRELLFGEFTAAYDVIIREYMLTHEVDMSAANTISSLIEIGAHKMGHVRSLEQLCQLD